MFKIISKARLQELEVSESFCESRRNDEKGKALLRKERGK